MPLAASLLTDLSGPWSFAHTVTPPAAPIRTAADLHRAAIPLRPCTVPTNLELDLHRLGDIPDPLVGMNIANLRHLERAHVFYTRRFTAARRPGYTTTLRFQGLDTYATIYLDGREIAATDNMLIEHTIPLDSLLTESATEHELVVHIRPTLAEAQRHEYSPGLGATHWEGLYIRKAPHMFGWDIMPRAVSAGIWRPVQLVQEPAERIVDVYWRTIFLAADRTSATVYACYLCALPDLPTARYELEIVATCGPSTVRTRETLRFGAGRIGFSIPHPQLWFPRPRGPANLYQATVTLLKDGQPIHSRQMRFGIRTVELLRTPTTDEQGHGEFCFRINGERVFILGANHVPADAYHARDAERLPTILNLAEEIGCNLLRCWGGNVYESDAFFDLCDQKGLMIWQDFALACAVYPQDAAFQERLATEARAVVRRLRNHPSLVLWAGDNECDCAHGWFHAGDPNRNVLTRQVLPDVLRDEDPARPFLPSSPCIDPPAYTAGEDFLPENHLWGPRNYFKSDYYVKSLCHFVSEIGYFGCPNRATLERFLSPERLWPGRDNPEWMLHSTSPMPESHLYDHRVELMGKHLANVFGSVPENLDDYIFASQAAQAEAYKFFIELFRSQKWRRTGIVWWNLIDGWPQFADSVVDYHFSRKLAYDYIRRTQRPLTLIVCEPVTGRQQLVAVNDTRAAISLRFRLSDVADKRILLAGPATAAADAVTPLGEIPVGAGQSLYLITWETTEQSFRTHYLAGQPPFDPLQYRTWMQTAELLPPTRP